MEYLVCDVLFEKIIGRYSTLIQAEAAKDDYITSHLCYEDYDIHIYSRIA